MAIKIIKQGKMTKFTKTCPDCGCEFEYEVSDLSTDYRVCLTTYPPKYNTYIVCPCCGKHLHHGYTTPAISSYPKPYCTSDVKCTSESYTVNPKDFNISTYTTSSYTSPDFTANYITAPELNKQAAYEYTIDTKE